MATTYRGKSARALENAFSLRDKNAIMHRFLLVVALGMAVLGGRVAHAGPTVEVGGTAGIHIFATDDALGVPQVSNADSQRNSALF
jgi:hypothetical protein